MRKCLLFGLSFLSALFSFAIDPSGSRPVSESSDLSGFDIFFFIIGGIFLVVVGIPFMTSSFQSDKKSDKDFGCFMLVGMILLVLMLLATCES